MAMPPRFPAHMTGALHTPQDGARQTLLAHLPAVVSGDTMTTLGLRLRELPTVYVENGQVIDRELASHLYVGMDAQGRYAFAVFPTWTGFTLSWMDAGHLAHLFHASLGDSVPSLWNMQPQHLYHRLVEAALPLPELRKVAQNAAGNADGVCDRLHTTYAALLSHKGAKALENTIVLARTEAADLARALVASWDDSPLAPFRSTLGVGNGAGVVERPALADSLRGLRPDGARYTQALRALAVHPSYPDPLLARLLDAAVPDVLFQGGHQRIAASALRMDACLRGAAALPPFLHPVAAPIEDPLM